LSKGGRVLAANENESENLLQSLNDSLWSSNQMAAIIVKNEDSLLIVYVSGLLTAEEVISVVKKYYTNEIVKDVIGIYQ
jgi:hypothetical protein